MNGKLLCRAILRFFLGVLLVGGMIFWPAGTLRYGNGWLLMAILFGPMFGVGLVLLVKKPALLASRLEGKETQKGQSVLVKCCGLMFMAGFMLSGFGVRFGWYQLPPWVVLLSAGIFLFAYFLYALVLRANTYLSRTIQVQEAQQVVTTGPYAIVRHPMYSATLLLFLSMPLVLGSVYAFLVFLLYPFLIIKRLLKEEQLLVAQLPGYAEYQKKVTYRLIPWVW